jgi:hypothetical protein
MGTHMKTTLDIADELLVRAKQLASERSVTLRSLVEAGLRSVLDEAARRQAEQPAFRLVTFRGSGLSEEYRRKGLLQGIYDVYDEHSGVQAEDAAPSVQDGQKPR